MAYFLRGQIPVSGILRSCNAALFLSIQIFFCSHLFASPLSVRHHMVKPAGLGPASQQALLSITCSSAAAPVRRSPNIPQQHFCAVGGVDPAASGPPRARKFETTSASACFCQRCCQAFVRFFFFHAPVLRPHDDSPGPRHGIYGKPRANT